MAVPTRKLVVMSPEQRPMPGPDPAGNGSDHAIGRASSAILVASSAESALAAVERHLRQEAFEARLVEPSTVVHPRPASDGRTSTTVRVGRSTLDDRWVDDDEAEFWGETRSRRPRPVDLTDLADDERQSVGRLRARKVRRILRHVSPWSVFKFSLFFYLCVWIILLVAGVILWRVGQAAGAISNIETFYAKATGEITFELDGRAVFRAASAAGVVVVLAGTAFTVMLSVMFNLITDLTGGVRLTVVELGDARRPVDTRRPGGRKLLRRLRSDRGDADTELASPPPAPAGGRSPRPADRGELGSHGSRATH